MLLRGKMAQATHRLSAASIEIDSSLDADKLRSLSDNAAADTVPTGIYKGAKARIRPNGRATATRQHYKIGTESRSMMTFSVSFASVDGGSQARSRIESFRTKQEMFLGFIPVGPRELLGWNWYQNFMRKFDRAVRAVDPSAQIEIIERAGGNG
jgi:hypothetical protein